MATECEGAGTANEELWAQYRSTGDPELRQQLILRNMPLVKYTVKRINIKLPTVLSVEDLVSHATIGLIDAIEHFDPDKGSSFAGYATLRLRGSVVDAIRKFGNYPRGMLGTRKAIEETFDTLAEELGGNPTDDQMAERMGISTARYRKMIRETSLTFLPLESQSAAKEGDDYSYSILDTLQDVHAPDPPSEAEKSELGAALLEAFRTLPKRHRTIIALHYCEKLTLKQIGQVLGVSESRISGLHAIAIDKLRKNLITAEAIT